MKKPERAEKKLLSIDVANALIPELRDDYMKFVLFGVNYTELDNLAEDVKYWLRVTDVLNDQLRDKASRDIDAAGNHYQLVLYRNAWGGLVEV